MTTDQTPKPFDLVELIEDADGFEAGTRGTVVIQGIGQSHVDFGWTDGEPELGSVEPPRCGVVPHRCMRVVRARNFDSALAERPSLPDRVERNGSDAKQRKPQSDSARTT
jgi:hypothetical protein